MRKNPIKIGVIGLWHLGCVYSSAFADLGFDVCAYDLSKENISKLNLIEPPIEEPGLKEIIKKNLGKSLFFLDDPKGTISNKKYVFLTSDMRADSYDKTVPDHIDDYFKLLDKFLSPNTIVVICSQVPIGTSMKLYRRLNRKNRKVKLIYFPENIRLGQAFERFFNPDRIILGNIDRIAVNQFTQDFNRICSNVFLMNYESAEMSKHALNSYLALNISFSSEIGDLCEALGAHLEDVVKAIKSDSRVSPLAPLDPGLGFWGGTLERDLKVLMFHSKEKKIKSRLINATYGVNQSRLKYIESRINEILAGFSNKKVGLLGLTYKAGTNTLRRSISLKLAKLLKRKGVEVRVIDPTIKLSINEDEFWRDLDLAVLMTNWPEFLKYKPLLTGRLMRVKNIFDTKNFLNQNEYKKAGFKYYSIGSK